MQPALPFRERRKMEVGNLPYTFFTSPEIARTTMSRKDVKELLLSCDGKIISCGRLRTLRTKHIGAGIYEVDLLPLRE